MQKLKLTKKYETYSEHKNSDVQWLGQIPSTWNVGKVKQIFNLSKKKVHKIEGLNILSLTQQGIKIRDISNNEGQIAATYEGYKKVELGDIVLNPMDLLSGFVDSAKTDGIISPAYSVLSKKDEKTNSQFYDYYFRKHYLERIFFPHGVGVSVDHRWTLRDDVLMNFPLIELSQQEQDKAVEYLDEKTALIDKIIEKKKKQIELFREKRTAIINQAVTHGLDRNSHLLESGIEWLGEIPKGWEIAKLKYRAVFNKNTLPENTDPDYLFNYIDIGSVNDGKEMSTGEEMKFSAAPSRARRIIKPHDSIIATVRTYLKAIGFFESIEQPIIVSTGFAVLSPGPLLHPKFLNYYLKSDRFINEVIIRSTGVSYPAITPFYLSSLEIIYPEMDKQNEIVNYLDEKLGRINLVINKIDSSIIKLIEFKSSLISCVVTGKVKV